MPSKIDLTGQRFGGLLVISECPEERRWKDGRKLLYWICQCDCGETTTVLSESLRNGKTGSCGCKKFKHRKTKTRAYRAWTSMKGRCYPDVKNYGSRGIKVCDRWLNSFEAFYEDMGDPPDGFTLDRIDSDGIYSPENCRWATVVTQNRNRKNSRMISYQGKTQCLAAWAEETGIHSDAIAVRLDKCNWSVEKALTTPVRKRTKTKETHD